MVRRTGCAPPCGEPDKRHERSRQPQELKTWAHKIVAGQCAQGLRSRHGGRQRRMQPLPVIQPLSNCNHGKMRPRLFCLRRLFGRLPYDCLNPKDRGRDIAGVLEFRQRLHLQCHRSGFSSFPKRYRRFHFLFHVVDGQENASSVERGAINHDRSIQILLKRVKNLGCHSFTGHGGEIGLCDLVKRRKDARLPAAASFGGGRYFIPIHGAFLVGRAGNIEGHA